MLADQNLIDVRKTKEHLDVVIVGGSLGGLAAGIALKSLGHNITIIERNPSPLLHNQGAGIVAGGDTLDFFKKYDRCHRDFACASQKRMYLNKAGEIVHEVSMAQAMTSWDLTYYLMRANYDGVESEYCTVPSARETDGTSRYRFGCTFTKVEDEGSKVRVYFEKHDDGTDSILADLLVGSDGPSSSVRKQFCPGVQRTLTGYAALRGTVPENEASDAAKEVFQERFTFFHCNGNQILAYLIPGKNGTTEAGERLINFVWYHNFPLGSQEFKDLMTDADGSYHNITLPPGKMSVGVAKKIKKIAKETLPPQFAEIVNKTRSPFAQAITDVISPVNSFMDGKVLLIGDALAGFRPHTVASTSQAAFNAMVLSDYIEGKKSLQEFVLETMQYGRLVQKRGAEMGNRSQFADDLPLEEHIRDRNVASTKRQDERYPAWTREGLSLK